MSAGEGRALDPWLNHGSTSTIAIPPGTPGPAASGRLQWQLLRQWKSVSTAHHAIPTGLPHLHCPGCRCVPHACCNPKRCWPLQGTQLCNTACSKLAHPPRRKLAALADKQPPDRSSAAPWRICCHRTTSPAALQSPSLRGPAPCRSAQRWPSAARPCWPQPAEKKGRDSKHVCMSIGSVRMSHSASTQQHSV